MFLYIVGTLVVLGVITTLLPGATARTVSYTEFKPMLRANDIASVLVSESRIRGSHRGRPQPGGDVDALC